MRVRALATALVLLAGCASDRSGPVDVFLFGEVGPGSYALAPHRLETISSVAEGRGSILTLLQGARIDFRTEHLDDGGGPVAISFFEAAGGTLVPADLESLTLLSFYGHVEDSVRYFEALGVNVAAFTPLATYVRANLGGAETTFVDNAAYASGLRAFLLPPGFFFQSAVPLPANDGVITHEFTHAVFHYLLNGLERQAREEVEGWPYAARNYLGGLNEGLADAHAALRISDPNFIAPSIPVASDRDMSVRRPYTAELRGSLESSSLYDPHVLGAVVGAAVWQASEAGLGRMRTATLLIASVQALRASYGPSFRISDWLNLFAGQATPAERAPLCGLLLDRFALIQSEITACKTEH